MNRLQIGLKLAMDELGIPVTMERYREICNAVYHVQKGGCCDLGYAIGYGIIFSPKVGAYSPMPHESSGMLRSNLATDVENVERELKQGFDESKGSRLDDKSRRFLNQLRADIETGTIKIRPNSS